MSQGLPLAAPADHARVAPVVSSRALLVLLAFANFAVGLTAFLVIGIVSPVAQAFALSKAEAGLLMTTYAVSYALTSPLLVAATGKHDRAHVLVAGVALLSTGATLAGLAPSYGLVLVGRVVMALGGGLVTPVAAAVAVATVEPAQRSRALALVFGGMTLAPALGVPLGAFIGYALGWRVAFGLVALLSLGGALVLGRFVPRGLNVPRTSVSTLRAVLATPRFLWAIAFTAFSVGSAFVMITYLAPFLEARHGLGRNGVTLMLFVFGVGAFLGNSLGRLLTERIGPTPSLVVAALAQLALMPVLTVVHLPLVATGALIGIWSVFGWSIHVPQQARLAALDLQKAPVLLALHGAAIYVGSSLGAALGGQALKRAGSVTLPSSWGSAFAPDAFSALGLVGSALALAALASIWLVARVRWKR
ncbi:MFS transporter [Chondromyces apiculatus]|uniref:Major facilitator superfamily MFS_1 n=1 Tax=Chondromyces apiculatus DSM 436 TaxID=1192034 RepID=A0A017T801_9BACT|nr:MFS transporter [Chondromyces apiculatus]EYF05067.1 major facilitator superfamily MFS_1 [Chondromyces apiculatus DSM 436]